MTSPSNGRESDQSSPSHDGRPAVLLDVMVGGLTAYLRMCGYDTVYALDRDVEADDRILALAREDDRVLVTRDLTLAETADQSVLIESRNVRDQLTELREAGFKLELTDEPTRCGNCNEPLVEVESGETTPEYAPDPADERVWRCWDCGQYFWLGSHWADVAETLRSL